jgi:hypothetical protein
MKKKLLVIKGISVLILSLITLLLLMWLKIFNPLNLELQCSPTLFLILVLITLAINVFSTAVLIKTKFSGKQLFIAINLASILLILIFLITFPQYGFTESNFNKVVDELSLSNVTRISAGAPASDIFLRDNDGSIDTIQIAETYGDHYTEWLLGELELDNNKVKVIITYQDGAFNPINSITIFEINKDFNIEVTEEEQVTVNTLILLRELSLFLSNLIT